MQASARERVLLVDDEPQVLVALEDLLCEQFIVLKSDSAKAALELVRTEPDIAVVITDQRMPRMSGDELLARLGDSSDAARILVTGFADLSAVIRAVNDGRIFAYVTKPWDPDDLRLKVSKAAEHFRLVKDLAYERQLLHDLMDNIPDGIYFKDRALRFRRTNRSFATSLQLGEATLVGRRLKELLPSDALADFSELEDQRILSEGKPILDALREYPQSPTRRWFSETKAPIRSPGGEIIGLVGISRDVTERVSMERALRTSERRLLEQTRVLNSILDSMADGVIVADRSGNLLLFNRQAEKLLGLSSSDVSANDWTTRSGMQLPEGGGPLPGNPLLLAMSGQESTETHVLLRAEGRSDRTLTITATPLRNEKNALCGGVVLLRNVTQQRELEQQLIQAQKMEAVGQLAGGVAHDFNNLLSVIQSYGELMREGLSVGDPQRDDLEQMLAASQRAAALTRQLLAFSRRQIVQSRLLQLNDVVSEIEKMLRRIIGDDVELVTALSASLGPIKADPTQIEQIILNLTINARDAMPEGGQLKIETASVSLDGKSGGAYAGIGAGDYEMLAVSDTGTGMDALTQKRIFEPFFTTKEVGKGTGLGLSTVYGIVQQCGAHIRVSSELGRGTEFKIFFPRSEGREVTGPTSLERSSQTSERGTILLVEDNDAVRLVAARILRARGYDVLDVARVGEARELCAARGESIDLLLTDVVMPDSSGPKLAEELTAQFPKLRVLFMSGYPGAALESTSVGSPVAYIEKPFTPASLIHEVNKRLRSD